MTAEGEAPGAVKNTPGKLPFFVRDFSDYARPVANWCVRRISSTKISPLHLTACATIAGFCAAAILTRPEFSARAAGFFLIQIKNLLDAMDGGLARVRGKLSRLGRFADTVSDFFVNLALAAALAAAEPPTWGLGLAAFLSWNFQSSAYNFIWVLLRRERGGDLTSRLDESELEAGAGRALRLFHRLYMWTCGWQDAILRFAEKTFLGEEKSRRAAGDARWAKWFSWHGLGIQLLIISGLALIGKPKWALWYFLVPANFLLLGLWIGRASQGRQESK